MTDEPGVRDPGQAGGARIMATLWRSAFRLAPANVCLLALLILAGGVAQLLLVLPSARVVQLIDDRPAGTALGWHALLPPIAAMCLLLLLASAARTLVHMYSWKLGRRFNGSTRARIMAAVSGPPDLVALEEPASRDRLSTATGVGPNRYNPGGALVRTANRAIFAVQVLTGVVMLAVLNVWLGLVVGATILICRRLFARSIAVFALELLSQAGEFRRVDYLRNLIWAPSAARELRIFRMWDWLSAQTSAAWDRVERRRRDDRRRAMPTVLVSAATFTVGFGIAFLVAFHAWSRGELSTHSGAVAFQVLIFLAVALSRTVVDADQSVELGARAVPAAEQLIRAAAEQQQHRGTVTVPSRGAAEIRCDALSFGYPWRDDDAEPVLRSVTMRVEAGDHVAIVGQNGTGKSTLLKLICGFYPVAPGNLFISGVDSPDLDRRDWQHSIAAVQQDFVRYPQTLEFNVALGPGADRDLIHDCLTDVGLGELPTALPDGYETLLQISHSLSGGQWQRIAIARALYKLRSGGARLLLLDEPTASLDPSAELELSRMIAERARGTTTITVSHRLSLVREATQIFVMEGGRIAESGSHESLIAEQGLYAAMFRAQSEGWVST